MFRRGNQSYGRVAPFHRVDLFRVRSGFHETFESVGLDFAFSEPFAGVGFRQLEKRGLVRVGIRFRQSSQRSVRDFLQEWQSMRTVAFGAFRSKDRPQRAEVIVRRERKGFLIVLRDDFSRFRIEIQVVVSDVRKIGDRLHGRREYPVGMDGKHWGKRPVSEEYGVSVRILGGFDQFPNHFRRQYETFPQMSGLRRG